jgi:glc operon protein GlcG
MRKVMLGCAMLLSSAALADSPAPPPPTPAAYGAPIGLAEARILIDRAIAQSEARGFKLAIAVVEPSGHLVAFARMDGVSYGTIQLAQQKAKTAALFRMTTAEAEARVQGGRMALLSADGFIAIGGGVPIVANGRVIGALGVSGAKAAEDAELAAAVVSAK